MALLFFSAAGVGALPRQTEYDDYEEPEAPSPPPSPNGPSPAPAPQAPSPPPNPCASEPLLGGEVVGVIDLDGIIGDATTPPGDPLPALSPACIAFLRAKPTAKVGILFHGSDVLRLNFSNGVPAGSMFVRLANTSGTPKAITAWFIGSAVATIVEYGSTGILSTGFWLRRPGPMPAGVPVDAVAADTIVFRQQGIFWSWYAAAFFDKDTFWELFDGKIVDFTWLQH